MARGLTWKLCDLTGATIARLDDRLPGGQVAISQNGNPSAAVPLSFDDPAVESVYPLATVLKVLLDGYPLFSGILMKPRHDGPSRTTTINTVGQGYRLDNFCVGQRAGTPGLDQTVNWNPWRYENYNQTSMMRRLVEYGFPVAAEVAAGIPGMGIAWGDVHATGGDGDVGNIPRTKDFAVGSTLWAGITDLASLEQGLDFQLTAVDRTDGTLCLFDTFYPQQGSDKTGSMVFHYNWGKHTASSFSYEPDGGPVINRYNVFGQSVEGQAQAEAIADQPEAQRAFGIYGKTEGRSDLYDYSSLAEVAQGVVSPAGWPQNFFEFTPAQEDGSGWSRDPSSGALVRSQERYGVGPKFGPGPQHDGWVGDYIRVIARDGHAFRGRFDGRVTDLTFTEADESGSVVTEVKATPIVEATGVSLS